MNKSMLMRQAILLLSSSSRQLSNFNHYRTNHYLRRITLIQKNFIFVNLKRYKTDFLNKNNELNDVKSTPTSPKRLIKKKQNIKNENGSLKLIAYSTAEAYNLESVKRLVLNEGIYEIIDIAADADRECLCLKAKYPTIKEGLSNELRYIFLFNDGTCVFWNCEDQPEQKNILNLVKYCSSNLYSDELIKSEIEMLTYSIDDTINQTRLHNNHISFPSKHKNNIDQFLLEKYTFSDAISLSIKLAILERNLDIFIGDNEHVSDDLKIGRKPRLSSEQVLQRTGTLLAMRHTINLRFDLLNVPDWYWDREQLENLYLSAIAFLDISKRTRVFNEKLNYCIDLMRILEANLNEKKHTRLEWYIIGLIAFEVVLGLMKFI